MSTLNIGLVPLFIFFRFGFVQVSDANSCFVQDLSLGVNLIWKGGGLVTLWFEAIQLCTVVNEGGTFVWLLTFYLFDSC